MPVKLRATLLMLLVPFVLEEAAACSRSSLPPPPMCERFWQRDAVALVEVMKIEKEGYSRRVTLLVHETYRGAPPRELIVEDGWSSCGVRFPQEGQYLAWLWKERNGRWNANGQPVSEVSEDLAYAQSMKLQSMQDSPPKARIFGTLDTPIETWVKFEPPGEPKPLPNRAGVIIQASGEGGSFAVPVTPDLTFEIASLPPGKYEVSVLNLPHGLSVDTEKVNLSGGGCKGLRLFSKSSASVSGTVRGDGAVPRYAQVYLIPLGHDNMPANEGEWELTDPRTGEFKFPHVEPGRYILGFELGDSPTLHVPYASRYFPEGSDPTRATVIEVSEGQAIENLLFDLGAEVPRRTVRVRVTWSDGTPAVNATAYLRDAHNSYSSVADKQTPTDANGEAILEGFADTDYDVGANAVCKGTSSTRDIKKVVIVASPIEASVQLTVPGQRCELRTRDAD